MYPARTKRTSAGGFALVIALAMMAFMLLLLVALSSLVTVETQRARAELEQFEARQNAIFGLRLAVARLQALTGVDRVATSRAEAIGTVVEGEGEEEEVTDDEVLVHASKRYWTGVFPVDQTIPHETLRTLGQWLVSGSPQSVDDIGQADADAAILLSFTNSGDESEVKVMAPRKAIEEDDSGGGVQGHYAYWISDESMKAKINVVNPLAELDPDDTDNSWQFASAQRFGAERVEGLGGFSVLYDRTSGADFDPYVMDRIISVGDLGLVGLADEDLDLGSRVMDLTTHSWGVLSDSRNGGLKRDLTTFFERPTTFAAYEFMVPEDIEDWEKDGKRTNVNQLTILLLHARGPSWELLRDYAHIYRELGPTGDSLAPRIGIGGSPPEGGLTMSNFATTMTIAPVLLYQGLTFGLQLVREGSEFVALTNLERDDLAILAEDDPVGGITDSKVKSNGDIQMFERVYYRIELTVEPVVALWNPFDVQLEAQHYLIEFNFSNGLWGAQPALYLVNTSIGEWVSLHSTESPTTALSYDEGADRWFVFPDDFGTPYDNFTDLFTSTERNSNNLISKIEQLNQWSFHLTEVFPEFVEQWQDQMEFDSYGRHLSGYNGYAVRVGTSNQYIPGAKIHNMNFAMRDVVLEPGEIKWYTLQGSNLAYLPENRILTEGFHGGYVAMPIVDSVGWRTTSQGQVDEGDTGGGTYRYLRPGYMSGSFDRRAPWVDQSGVERSWIDIGRVIIDVPLDSSPGVRYMGMDGVTLGLGHRSGQYSVALRMLSSNPSGGNLVPYLEFPFGDGTELNKDNETWTRVRYVNVFPAGNSQANQVAVVNPEGWRRELLSTGIHMLSPSQDTVNFGATTHNTGVKILSAHNVLSGYNGWNEYRDPSLGSADTERLGYRSSATYGFALEYAPTNAFDQYRLWHEAAIVRESADNPEYRAVLFHLPREELFSVGQFQHLPISRSPWDPTYVVGNSFASPWIPADSTWVYLRRTESTDPLVANFTLHDRSYYINNALVDSTFFSTWRPGSDPQPKNRRLVVISPLAASQSLSYTDADTVAARLVVNGPFNVNSTSVEAWKALLGSMNLQALKFRDVGAEATVEMEGLRNPFLRSPKPSGGPAKQPEGGQFPAGDSAYWRGFRELDDEQIAELAEAIVAEIRKRGPFRTIGEFVNRRPGPASSPEALRGTIQAAIEAQSSESDNPINPPVSFGNVEPGGGSVINEGNYAFPEAALGPRHEAAPGFLTQADVLSPLLPVLTARGDTFVIRAYGDVVRPGDDSVTSRAVCEAVVQRLPEYVDPSDGASVAPDDLTSEFNARFGRRYVILQVRWLNEDEI